MNARADYAHETGYGEPIRDAERNLLNILLHGLATDTGTLTAEQFHYSDTRTVFELYQSLIAEGKPADRRSVTRAVTDDEARLLVINLGDPLPLPNIRTEIRIIQGAFAQRQAVNAWEKIEALARDRRDFGEVREVAEQAEFTSLSDQSAIFGEVVDIFDNMGSPLFPVDLLPGVVADYAMDQAELIGVDAGVIGMAAIGAMAGCIDDRIQLQPKRYDPTWLESARLWIGIIGDPSTKKSPGIKKAVSPVNRVAEKWRKQHQEAVKQWEDACQQAQAEDKKAKLPPPPEGKRLTVSDTTVEKLGDILSKQEPRGILVLRDELSGWLASMDAYRNGAGKDRPAWLEAYNGGPLEIDRIGRGSIFVPNWSATVIGGIQPSVIDDYANVTNHDGMLQRFLLYYATTAPPGEDRQPNMMAKDLYGELIDHLAHLQPAERSVILSDDAHQVREAFNSRLHKLVTSTPNKHLSAMLGKWEGTFARLLLAFHCVDAKDKRYHPLEVQVSGETAAKVDGLLWRVILPHSIAFYNGIDPAEKNSRLLAGLLLARKWHRFTVKRDLNNNMLASRRMTDREKDEMLDRLEAYGWIAGEPGKLTERGRPSAYKVNPVIHVRFKEQAEQEILRRADCTEIINSLKQDCR